MKMDMSVDPDTEDGATAGALKAPAAPRPALVRHKRRRSLNAYLERLLGHGSATQARTWLLRSFGARSFSEFWRYWNPVYGYFLHYYCYKPLRRRLPRPAAVWLTFVACGFFLHDAPGWMLARHVRFPEMTAIFMVFGAGVIMAEALKIDLARMPLPIRIVVNAAYLVGSWEVAHLLTRLAGPG